MQSPPDKGDLGGCICIFYPNMRVLASGSYSLKGELSPTPSLKILNTMRPKARLQRRCGSYPHNALLYLGAMYYNVLVSIFIFFLVVAFDFVEKISSETLRK